MELPELFISSMEPEPVPQLPIADLVKEWTFASGTIGVYRMLESMKPTVSHVLDPLTLWDEMHTMFPLFDERTMLDRFLQVVAIRLRHAEIGYKR